MVVIGLKCRRVLFPQKTGLLTKRQSSELAGCMPVLFSKPLEAALISQELETARSSAVLFSSQLMRAGSGSTQGPPYLILDPLILSYWLGETNRITGRALKCFSGSTIFLSCISYAKTTGETIKLIFFFFLNTSHRLFTVEYKVRRVLGPSHYHLAVLVIQEIGLRAGRPLRQGYVLQAYLLIVVSLHLFPSGRPSLIRG